MPTNKNRGKKKKKKYLSGEEKGWGEEEFEQFWAKEYEKMDEEEDQGNKPDDEYVEENISEEQDNNTV